MPRRSRKVLLGREGGAEDHVERERARTETMGYGRREERLSLTRGRGVGSIMLSC